MSTVPSSSGPLKRSQSAPTVTKKLVPLHQQNRQKSFAALSSKPKRLPPRVSSTSFSTGYKTPSSAKDEDPFNLVGFFGKEKGREGSWDWVYQEEDEGAEDDYLSPQTPGLILDHLLEEEEDGFIYQQEADYHSVIQNEDKMGILAITTESSLRFLPLHLSSTPPKADPDEPPHDHDSLHSAISARRRALHHHLQKEVKAAPGIGKGDLFFATDDKIIESGGWEDYVMRGFKYIGGRT